MPATARGPSHAQTPAERAAYRWVDRRREENGSWGSAAAHEPTDRSHQLLGLGVPILPAGAHHAMLSVIVQRATLSSAAWAALIWVRMSMQ
jgi:hypothetical protein